MSDLTSGVVSTRAPRHFLGASTLGLALTCVVAPAESQTIAQGANNQGAMQLPNISVEAQDGSTSYKVDQPQSPKFTAPLLDTPKTVTIVPQEVIKDQGATSLADVLRSTPGITLGSGEGGNPIGDRPFIRGFDAMTDTFVDGLRDPASQTREVFNLEQVEVSKGPSSAYTGRGGTGGSINLVTKMPQNQNFTAGAVTLGTDHTKRAVGDVNYVIGDGVALRLNAMGHDGDVAGRDAAEVSRWGIAPSLAFGLNGPTRAKFSYYHLQTDDMPDYGVPWNPRTGRPVDVDRHNFYGLKNRDFQRTQTDSGTAQFEHDLTSNVTVRNTTRYSRSTNDYIVTNPDDSKQNVLNGLVWRSPKTRNSVNTALINQTDLYGTFTLGGFKNSFSTGIELSREQTGNRPYVVAAGSSTATNNCRIMGASAGFNCTSLFNPNPDDPWTGAITRSPTRTETTTTSASAYAFNTVELTEQWAVNGGLRLDRYKTEVKPTNLKNDSTFLNYQVGVVYKPVPYGAFYVSHGTSSNPSGENAGEGTLSLSATNQNIDPEENVSYEIGTKWELLNRKLLATGAIFRTEKTNARVNDPLGGSQLLVGDQRVDGFEVGLSGSITDAWKIFAGYTFLYSEIIDGGPQNTNEGKEFPNVPRHNFSVWTTYVPVEKLTVGGGALFMSKRYADPANLKSVPSFWRFDAMASYQVTDNVAVQLNVQNLTNETYYDKLHPAHFATIAPGRTALLTTSVKF
ncbi:MAG TPA: TonB-dependent siderophore receptor [Azospirillum sp.]|nr:TonB-dependent siderophore receptor [Azospirillum sp.]